MLVNTKLMLKKAQKEGYAVGAFNTSDLEMTKAIVNACVKLNSPVIIQTSEKAIKYAGLKEIYNIVKTIANSTKIPIALHLDHGKDINLIKKCVQNGYTSIMIDASEYEFKKNINITKKVVNFAHKKNIPVEAELGMLKGIEDGISSKKNIYTDPEQAKKFVKLTNIDSLAVAIGTSHGAYKFKGKPKIDLKRLKEISNKVSIPLVLHGASGVLKEYVNIANKYGAELEDTKGVPDLQIKKAIKQGVCKVNIDTDLRLAFDAAIRKKLHDSPKEFDPRKILEPAIEAITKVVEKKIILLGSGGKA